LHGQQAADRGLRPARQGQHPVHRRWRADRYPDPLEAAGRRPPTRARPVALLDPGAPVSDDMIAMVLDEARDKMAKAVEHARSEFTSVRTGRATPALVE